MYNKFAEVWVWVYFLVFSVLPISWSLPILQNLALRWSSTFDVSNLQSIKVNCAKWGFLGFCKVQQKKASSSKNGGETSIDFLFKNKCRRVLFYQLGSLKIFLLDTRCHVRTFFARCHYLNYGINVRIIDRQMCRAVGTEGIVGLHILADTWIAYTSATDNLIFGSKQSCPI